MQTGERTFEMFMGYLRSFVPKVESRPSGVGAVGLTDGERSMTHSVVTILDAWRERGEDGLRDKAAEVASTLLCVPLEQVCPRLADRKEEKLLDRVGLQVDTGIIESTTPHQPKDLPEDAPIDLTIGDPPNVRPDEQKPRRRRGRPRKHRPEDAGDTQGGGNPANG